MREIVKWLPALAMTLGTAVSAFAASAPKVVFHLDFNVAQLKATTVSNMLERVAADGYNAILWEIEDKVRWESAPFAEGAFTKAEFRALLAKAKSLGLEPIPLMQTFGHAEYVLRHPQYAALREDPEKWGCYCVSKPETRRFLKTLLHEYLELFGEDVKWFHLGGDEAHGFGKCGVCSKRHPMELYGEHLAAVSEELRARGIRPSIWCDMVFGDKYAAGADRVPRDFTIWNWDYEVPAHPMCKWTKRLDQMKKLGFKTVFAVATASWGDGPFLPDMRYHRLNADYGAAYARTNALDGFCVTSWAVRQNPKRLQLPLIDFAAKRFLSPAADAADDWQAALDRNGVKMSAEALDELSGWMPLWSCYDSRSKVPLPPPPGAWWKIKPELGTRDLADFLAGEKRIERALAEASGEWKLAGELQLKMLRTARLAVEGKDWPAPPVEETRRFLGVEQTPSSAETSADLIWGYWEKSSDLKGRSLLKRH